MNKRYAIIADNSCEYVKTIFDVWNAEDTVVLIDYRIPIKYMEEMLNKTNIDGVYTDNEDLAISLKDKEYMVIKMQKRNTEYDLVHVENLTYKQRKDDKEALILFSSGTTGINKGVVLSYKSIFRNAKLIAEYKAISRSSTILIYKSLAHCASLIGELLATIIANGRLYVARVRLLISQQLRLVEKLGVTHLSVNPTVISLAYKCLRLGRKYDFKSLKLVTCSGVILSRDSKKRAENFFCCDVVNSYGLTEVCAMFSVQKRNRHDKGIMHDLGIESVGYPLCGANVYIMRDGKEVERGKKGDVYITSQTMMQGYLNGKMHVNKYFDTGDVGIVDKDGELYILGRKDRKIISAGRNVCPEIIEERLLSSNLVDECMIVPEKDENYGQIAVCYYYKSDIENSNLLREEIIDFCNREFAVFERPQKYIYISKFKHTYSGKKKLPDIVGEMGDNHCLEI